MIQGTTPTLRFKVRDANFNDIQELRLVLKQNKNSIVKLLDQVSIDDNVVSITLTEEETMSFSKGDIFVQLWYKKSDKSFATNIVTLKIETLL